MHPFFFLFVCLFVFSLLKLVACADAVQKKKKQKKKVGRRQKKKKKQIESLFLL